MATATSLQLDQRVTDRQKSAVGSRIHHMPYGAEVLEGGRARFRIWAPGAESIALEIEGRDGTTKLEREADGWHGCVLDGVGAGTRYRYVLGDGTRVPDPASRFQPEDVHGPSEVVDPARYAWTDLTWTGLPWSEAVVYELHLGTFTEEGTFRAAIEKLNHLAELGVTALQIMPVADFAGTRNWGYDGVLPYAPDSSYGRPEDFKDLVQAAHARGMMVLLDVVYNHFGPDGNYLSLYAPQTFTDRHKTPWGDAVNYDGEGSAAVRGFVLHNVLYWLEEFHLDGLRFDAVHQIKDDSGNHLLDEIATSVRKLDWGRSIHLVLENERNQAHRLRRDRRNQPEEYTAQWNDDLHHVLHTAATGENHAYYADFADDADRLGRALAQGFAFQGERMECLGHERGEPSAFLPPTAFVSFIQNHDQVGNRAFGERLNAIAPPEAVRALVSTYLLLPQVPMLFMGEEWASTQPFPFFCDFPGELGELVRQGRRQEFAKFPEFQNAEQRERIPDPQAEQTFRSGKLDWQEAGTAEHAGWLAFYKELLQVRRERIWPLIDEIGAYAGQYRVLGAGAVCVRWELARGAVLTLVANLSSTPVESVPDVDGSTLWQEGPAQAGGALGPWSVRWSIQDAGAR